jgi:hypothetical protein
MKEMTYSILTGAIKSEGDRLAQWFEQCEEWLLADFRVAVRHSEYREKDFERFLSHEWLCHCHELQENAINFANGDY